MGLPEVMAYMKEQYPEVYGTLAPQESPEAQALREAEQQKKDAETLSTASDILNPLPIAPNILSLPADVMQFEEGRKAMYRGDNTGMFDVAAGGFGFISDVTGAISGLPGAQEILGDLSAVTGSMQGMAETGKGGYEIYQGAESGDSELMVKGAGDGLTGIKDYMSSSGDPRMSLLGKSFGFGMLAGNTIAPWLMGDKDESAEVRQSDGDYVPSTGWCVTDWISGTGKYTDSRWHADGERVTNTPELTEADMENPYVKLALQIAAND